MEGEAYDVDYRAPLGLAIDWVRVRIRKRRGRVERFVVQYETVIGVRLFPVVRYDCEHGFIHRDTLDHRGNVIDKEPLAEQVDLNHALQEALRELTTEWQAYRDAFVATFPEERAP